MNTSQQTGLLSSIKSLNPFGSEGYVRLPTTEGAGAPLPAASRREEDEGWFAREFTIPFLSYSTLPTSPEERCATRGSGYCPRTILSRDSRLTSRTVVSRWDRLLVFGGCNLAALACFVICFVLSPALALKPRKFATL